MFVSLEIVISVYILVLYIIGYSQTLLILINLKNKIRLTRRSRYIELLGFDIIGEDERVYIRLHILLLIAEYNISYSF